MKVADMRVKTRDELMDQLLDLKKETLNLRFQQASGQLEATARVREVRKDIARLQTVLREKRQGESQG
jgi:large subunit ribosomal protein L29